MSTDFKIKDSGERVQFAGGMVRDTAEGKIDYELIYNGPMFDRWAAHLTKGEVKYPADPKTGQANWMKAEGQAEYHRARKSAARHFRQWMRGDQDEDHAAAVFFNINLAEYIEGRSWTTVELDAEAPAREHVAKFIERVNGERLPAAKLNPNVLNDGNKPKGRRDLPPDEWVDTFAQSHRELGRDPSPAGPIIVEPHNEADQPQAEALEAALNHTMIADATYLKSVAGNPADSDVASSWVDNGDGTCTDTSYDAADAAWDAKYQAMADESLLRYNYTSQTDPSSKLFDSAHWGVNARGHVFFLAPGTGFTRNTNTCVTPTWLEAQVKTGVMVYCDENGRRLTRLEITPLPPSLDLAEHTAIGQDDDELPPDHGGYKTAQDVDLSGLGD